MTVAIVLAVLLLAVWVLLLSVLVLKTRILVLKTAIAFQSLHAVVMPLANDRLRHMLARPLVYCPRHGGQEQVDGVCVRCAS
jgi:hypothetical protein